MYFSQWIKLDEIIRRAYYVEFQTFVLNTIDILFTNTYNTEVKVNKTLTLRQKSYNIYVGGITMLSFYEMVGQRIIERLNELGWTRQRLADELKISKQVMSKILNGEKNTTILEIRDISEKLRVSFEKLLSPINEKLELITESHIEDSLMPVFMGDVTTPEGQAGVGRALDIINVILKHQELYDEAQSIGKQRVNFSGYKKIRTFDPSL